MKPRSLGLLFIIFWLSFLSPSAHARETWIPFQPRPEQALLRIWTAGGRTFAQVTLGFPSSGYRVTDWGRVERNGNEFSVDLKVEEWTGGSLTVITYAEHTYELGALAAGSYTLNVKSRGSLLRSQSFDPSQIEEHWEGGAMPQIGVSFAIRTIRNVAYSYVDLFFPDTGYRVADWGSVVRQGNETTIDIKVERWTGMVETRTFSRRQAYVLGELPPGAHTVHIRINGAPGRDISFNAPVNVFNGSHPTEAPDFFVRQHYLDFLNREPDSNGLTFWYNEIVMPCNGLSPCMLQSRINPSAAFFLSVEFRETGYLVYLLYKAAYGRMLRFQEFLPDTQSIGQGVVVNSPGWQTALETNKQSFVNSFVQRAEFRARYPESMTAEQYVDALNSHTAASSSGADANALSLSQTERDALVQGLRTGTETRASVLRKVAEHATFSRRELNRAFVLMQYFGYLRRNPDDAPDHNWEGYNFWLRKLEEHGGNYISAEMINSFITSGEYRRRFDP